MFRRNCFLNYENKIEIKFLQDARLLNSNLITSVSNTG